MPWKRGQWEQAHNLSHVLLCDMMPHINIHNHIDINAAYIMTPSQRCYYLFYIQVRFGLMRLAGFPLVITRGGKSLLSPLPSCTTIMIIPHLGRRLLLTIMLCLLFVGEVKLLVQDQTQKSNSR
jgi:hypothetical protein